MQQKKMKDMMFFMYNSKMIEIWEKKNYIYIYIYEKQNKTLTQATNISLDGISLHDKRILEEESLVVPLSQHEWPLVFDICSRKWKL